MKLALWVVSVPHICMIGLINMFQCSRLVEQFLQGVMSSIEVDTYCTLKLNSDQHISFFTYFSAFVANISLSCRQCSCFSSPA